MRKTCMSGSTSGMWQRDDGPLGEVGSERRRLLSAPPVLYVTAPPFDSTEPPAEDARCAAAARASAGRDAVVLGTRRGSGRPNGAADDGQIAFAGGGLVNSPGQGRSQRLGGHITFHNGQVQQAGFADYPILRLSKTPAIDSRDRLTLCTRQG